MTEEEKQLEELKRKGFALINKHIEEGATPKERAQRTREILDILTGKEVIPQKENEDYDTYLR